MYYVILYYSILYYIPAAVVAVQRSAWSLHIRRDGAQQINSPTITSKVSHKTYVIVKVISYRGFIIMKSAGLDLIRVNSRFIR